MAIPHFHCSLFISYQALYQLRTVPVEEYSVADVKRVCAFLHINHDTDLIDELKVDGKTLITLSSLPLVCDSLGIEQYGSACFMLTAIQQCHVNHISLAMVHPLHQLPASPTDVKMWSVDQACMWLQQNNLAVLEPAFRKQDINGLVLLHMNVPEFGMMAQVKPKVAQELRQALSTLLAQCKPCLIQPSLLEEA
jgi:hypothetical protein